VRLWLAEEVAPGRLIPWLPIAFASGILVYFAAQHEPIVVPAPALALALILAAILARARPVAFPLLVAAAAGCAGFATITLKSALIAHPVLHHSAGGVTVAGCVLIAPSGDLAAVRGADGKLAVIKKGGDAFAVKEWLAADADARTTADPTLASGVVCDAVGCNARLRDRSLVALTMGPEAFAEDCRRAVLVVSSRTAPPDCSATAIDRAVRMRSGALALRRVGNSWEITPARPDGYDRPWARSRGATAAASASEPSTAASKPKPSQRDAAPKPADLGPDD
jgi:hypothetical protein